jgi:triphosphatase
MPCFQDWKDTMEIEFKFGVPAERLHTLEAAMADGTTTTTRLQARYFDTADGCLAAHGVALRLRHEGSQWVQTAKAFVAGQGPLHRLEHNAPLDEKVDPGHGVTLLIPDIGRHAGTPVGQLLERLLDQGRTPLVQTMATDIVRRAQHETLNGTTVELALDQFEFEFTYG